MASYWYSTDGMDRKHLPNRHLDVLDRAYERRARVEIYDEQVFGPNVPAIADPYLGTMTAGDIHYGLYRHPSLRTSDTSLDTLIFADSTIGILASSSSNNNNNTTIRRSSNSVGMINNNHSVSRSRHIGQSILNNDQTYNVSSDHNTSQHQQPNDGTSSPGRIANRSSIPMRRSILEDEDCVCCIIS